MPRSLTITKHVKIQGSLTCKSGLRIGATAEGTEIGGIDNPIIRDPVTQYPYLPGSSLKGKLRSIMEYKLGKVDDGGRPCGCAQADCLVCTVFGPHMKQDHPLGPSRIIVRDALLNPESMPVLDALLERGLLRAEVKSENIIDRRTGIAARGGLRTMERVPAGTKFDLEIVLRIFDGDNEKEIVDFVTQSLDMLDKEALGGSGSRGYGWVQVEYEVSDP
ncbi:MAG: type III-A CRISPR-associated RAMP protein Csm3 [Bacillota bacterium]|nr:type III-A CRISPR-associated RAMP protein Csm3 [Bacillota bacterium]